MKHTKFVRITDIEKDKPLLEEAAQIIRAGGLVVFPTETVYGLGGNGLDVRAIHSIYEAKGRPSDNPVILHVAGQEAVRTIASVVTPTAQRLLDTFWPGPLTIIFPRQAHIPDAATGGLETIAIRWPSHPLAHEFLRLAQVPVAAPSANISGRPSPTTAEEVAADMDGRVDMILDSGPCDIGVESTVVECGDDSVTILRPGGVTEDMLRRVVSRVELDTHLVTGQGIPKAPGMKYRHYAPSAPMTVVTGPMEEIARKLGELYAKALQDGQTVGFLVSEEVGANFPQTHMFVWGHHGDKQALANQLYTGLLSFDGKPVDLILAEGTDTDGLGLAIMNRMKKAAGGHWIKL